MAGDLVKDGLGAGLACAFVAQLLTIVVAAFQWPSAGPGTNVLGLDAFILPQNWGGAKWPVLLFYRQSFSSFALAGAATLVTGVTSAAERSTTDASTLGGLYIALMTKCLCGRSTASTGDVRGLAAWRAPSSVAYPVAVVPAD